MEFAQSTGLPALVRQVAPALPLPPAPPAQSLPLPVSDSRLSPATPLPDPGRLPMHRALSPIPTLTPSLSLLSFVCLSGCLVPWGLNFVSCSAAFAYPPSATVPSLFVSPTVARRIIRRVSRVRVVAFADFRRLLLVMRGLVAPLQLPQRSHDAYGFSSHNCPPWYASTAAASNSNADR